jgi:hypothetical protein
MNKKYIVRLSDTERGVLREVIKQLKGSSQKARRAQILLKADVDGPGWTDEKSRFPRIPTQMPLRAVFMRWGCRPSCMDD